MSALEKPALDGRAFRHALGQFPTGVCVVTCRGKDEDIGMTMSSFNSLSLDPPLVLFSVDRRAMSLPQWEAAGGYAINVLADNQQAISNRFARAGTNKWEGAHFERGFADAPVLTGVAAAFECRRWATHDGGDHVLFVAEVVRLKSAPDRQPLVFSKGRYARLEQTTDVAPWPLDIHY
ncbi:flavin reductase family protein [Pelagibacterium lentulum]|uniref:Flavin reductase like domain-containing protein n=1 Tax=Pelagibacterium lentulum TaxID=2029865 RepID=A0A916RAH8_9HYPH|nr:flavin reductase family protein [Pelagibacterium lentulum]GGA48474.1 hypothetical protein GCM10011499_17830 [Pelagibacterium lentulum]